MFANVDASDFIDIVKSSSIDQIKQIIEHIRGLENSDSLILAMVNKKDYQKYSPVHIAIFSRNFCLLELLLQSGADVNAKCHGTPIIHLITTTFSLPNGAEFVKHCYPYILNHPMHDLFAKDDQLSTVLHTASDIDCLFAAEMILNHSGTTELLEAKDRLGFRPIHRCCVQDSKLMGQKLY